MFSAKLGNYTRVLVWICALGSLEFPSAIAQQPPAATSGPADETTNGTPTAPVMVDGVTLFSVRGVSVLPPEKRAERIAGRIKALAANRSNSTGSLRLQEASDGTRIVGGDQIIMAVLDADAQLEAADRQVLAQTYLGRIGEAVQSFRRDREPKLLIRHALYAVAAILALALVVWLGRRIMRRTRSALERRYGGKIHGVKIQSFQIIRPEHLWRVLRLVLNVAWGIVVLAAAYMTLHYVLSLFPWTRALANSLYEMVMTPLATMGTSLLNAVPNLIFLAILAVVTWYALKMVRLFFASVETGKVKLSGFEAEWAKPTARLVRIGVIACAVVVGYPYIPGSNSQAFKGVSVLAGVIFSLGSTSLIGNIIAGYSMTYRRVFKQGDRVKIGDHFGIVADTKLMVTYLRTTKNEIVAVPNSEVVNGDVVNYSSLAANEGLILHTTIGIGYHTPWRQVEAMLLKAAELTPGLLHEPSPFVLQKELGEFAVTYEINAYSHLPQSMERLYGALHKNILDVFNEYGVQIMTPAYEGDPEHAKVVPKNQWYSAPAAPPDSDVSRTKDEPAATAPTSPPVKAA
jgi:small-conductance mechanosensitive channel